MGKIIKYAVKRMLVKRGIVMCKMCDDAIATHMQDLCSECYDDFADMQLEQYMSDMKGLLQ